MGYSVFFTACLDYLWQDRKMVRQKKEQHQQKREKLQPKKVKLQLKKVKPLQKKVKPQKKVRPPQKRVKPLKNQKQRLNPGCMSCTMRSLGGKMKRRKKTSMRSY